MKIEVELIAFIQKYAPDGKSVFDLELEDGATAAAEGEVDLHWLDATVVRMAAAAVGVFVIGLVFLAFVVLLVSMGWLIIKKIVTIEV